MVLSTYILKLYYEFIDSDIVSVMNYRDFCTKIFESIANAMLTK